MKTKAVIHRLVMVALAAGMLDAQIPARITAVTSAASFDPSQNAFLGYVSIFGSGLSDGTYSSPNANYGTKLGPTEIFVCETKLFTDLIIAPGALCSAAKIVFASPGQVNVVLPSSAVTLPSWAVSNGVTTTYLGQNSYIVARVGGVLDSGQSAGSPFSVNIFRFAPSIFLAGSDCLTNVTTPTGCGIHSAAAVAGQAERGIITDLAGNLIWSGNRARLGQYYTAWLTGLGSSPIAIGIDTLVPAYGYEYPSLGYLKVTYAGATPQFPGLYQVNFQIPLEIGEGPSGYGAWPCGNYNWELPMDVSGSIPYLGLSYVPIPSTAIMLPLSIRKGDVACSTE